MFSRHVTTFWPDFNIVVLRDIDADADPGASQAITRLNREEADGTVAVSSGYGIYLHAVQNRIPLTAVVEVRREQPASSPEASVWTGPTDLYVDLGTGLAVIGDNMGAGIDGINPPQGAGRYQVEVYHQGRGRIRELLRQFENLDDPAHQDAFRREHEGAERYLLRLWWNAELPEEDDDE
jgi:hypothetical protein